MKTITCMYCNQPIAGRADKKFCDDQCRGNYHYHERRQTNAGMNRINSILRRNRRALDILCDGQYGVTDVRTLMEKGFVAGYTTQVISEPDQSTWFMCYDIGIQFLKSETRVAIRRFTNQEE